MSNLVLKTEHKSPLALALQDEKLFSLSDKEAKLFIGMVATKIKHEAGQVWQQGELPPFIESAFLELKTLFPQVTKAELNLLCSKGVRGEYGENMGINIITLNKWIKGFLSAPERVKIKRELREMEQVEQKPDLDKTEREYRATIKHQFDKYKKTGVLSLTMPAILYDYLTEKGIMPVPDKAKKHHYFNKAKGVLVSNLKKERLKNALNGTLRNEINLMLDKIQSKNETDDIKTRIKVEAKLLAIKDFYDSISDLKI